MQSFLFKYIIIGDSSVGKSCLLMRFLDNKFRQEHESTIGVEFGSKQIDILNRTIKLQIWDTAGQESFKSITRSYYRGSICAILVYDITSKDSFDSCEKWLEETKTYSHDKMTIVLVGNKSDLEEKREIPTEKGAWFANKYEMLFFECSAKIGFNIEEIFLESAKDVIRKIDKGDINPNIENVGIKIDMPLKILSQTYNSKLNKKNCNC